MYSILEHDPWPESYQEQNFENVNKFWVEQFGVPIEKETIVADGAESYDSMYSDYSVQARHEWHKV